MVNFIVQGYAGRNYPITCYTQGCQSNGWQLRIKQLSKRRLLWQM
jgi:hypothetical protein